MPKKQLTPQQRAKGEAKLRRRYNAEKKKHDRLNKRRKIKVDWPYEDFLDFAARVGHLFLDIGEWGVVSISDLISSAVAPSCDEGYQLVSFPSWHKNAGDPVCVKCPAGTFFSGWNADGSYKCSPYTSEQEGYIPRPPKEEAVDPVPPPAVACANAGGFPTYSPKLGKNICVVCKDGGTFIGFNDNGDPICGDPEPASETSAEEAAGGMQKRRRRVRRKAKKTRKCVPPSVKAHSPKTGKSGCYRCADPNAVFQGFDAQGNPRCGPPEGAVTGGTRRKRKGRTTKGKETTEERRARIKRDARLSPKAKKTLLDDRIQGDLLEKAREKARLRKEAERKSVENSSTNEERARLEFIRTFGGE